MNVNAIGLGGPMTTMEPTKALHLELQNVTNEMNHLNNIGRAAVTQLDDNGYCNRFNVKRRLTFETTQDREKRAASKKHEGKEAINFHEHVRRDGNEIANLLKLMASNLMNNWVFRYFVTKIVLIVHIISILYQVRLYKKSTNKYWWWFFVFNFELI